MASNELRFKVSVDTSEFDAFVEKYERHLTDMIRAERALPDVTTTGALAVAATAVAVVPTKRLSRRGLLGLRWLRRT